jgi:uncharacterized protein
VNIIIYGASGMIGQRVTQEALNRGHKVTAIVRNPSRLTLTHSNLNIREGNILDPNDVARTVAGLDAVINATRQAADPPGQTFADAAHALIDGLTRAGVAASSSLAEQAVWRSLLACSWLIRPISRQHGALVLWLFVMR